MPNELRSEIFNKLSILSPSTSNTFQFDKSIDFFQQVDPNLISFPNATLEQWTGAVLAPNGKIYAVPNSSDTPANLLEFDPTTGSTTLIPFNNPDSEYWTGAVLAPNGKIYAVPNSGNISAKLLEFDPTTSSVNLTSFPNATQEYWNTAVLAPNGKIYAVPASGLSSANLLEINPINGSTTLIPFNNPLTDPNDSLSGEEWFGTVIAPNGKIYAVPNSGNSSANLLEINPINGSTTLIPFNNPLTDLNDSSSGEKWFGAVLAPNGKIYAVPNTGYISANLLEFDPTTGSTTLIPFQNATQERWTGAVLAPNGKIYAVPASGNSSANLLEINPTTVSSTSPPTLIPFNNPLTDPPYPQSGRQFFGVVIAPNGKIYAVPYSRNNPAKLLEFSRTFPQLMNDWILYPQFNKF